MRKIGDFRRLFSRRAGRRYRPRLPPVEVEFRIRDRRIMELEHEIIHPGLSGQRDPAPAGDAAAGTGERTQNDAAFIHTGDYGIVAVQAGCRGVYRSHRQVPEQLFSVGGQRQPAVLKRKTADLLSQGFRDSRIVYPGFPSLQAPVTPSLSVFAGTSRGLACPGRPCRDRSPEVRTA